MISPPETFELRSNRSVSSSFNHFALIVLAILGLSACSANSNRANTANSPGSDTVGARDSSSAVGDDDSNGLRTKSDQVGFTHIQPEGNRYVRGKGRLPDTEPVKIELSGVPKWIVGVPNPDSSRWAVVFQNGATEAFEVTSAGSHALDLTPSNLAEGAPPLLDPSENTFNLLDFPSEKASRLTHPVPLADGDAVAFIDQTGRVVFERDSGRRQRIDVDALPDARLTGFERKLVVLGGATNRYGHGVIGDEIEASKLFVLDPSAPSKVSAKWGFRADRVVEGIAPIVADLDQNGRREIIVTTSGEDKGARIVAFDSSGNRVAAGPAIGRGFRWRHQLAVAPFGPDGQTELADVLTPHIGGEVEFYRLTGDELEVVATVSGYSSHSIGSRNLDMAAAGDFDGDGGAELLVPTNAQTALGGIHRTSEGATTEWQLELGAELKTNLTAVEHPNGTVSVAAGLNNKTLLVWPGQ